MRTKICLILLLSLIATMGGCLEGNKIKEGQIQFKELTWKNPSSFDLIVNNEGKTISKIEIRIGSQKADGFVDVLKNGENIIHVYSLKSDTPFKLSTQPEKSELSILAVPSQMTGENAINVEKPVEILRRVVDMPFINVEVKPNNLPIHKTGDYVTITNKGNIPGDFSITQKLWYIGEAMTLEHFNKEVARNDCGINSLNHPTYTSNLDIGSSKNFYLKIDTFSERTKCSLTQGKETGATPLSVIYYAPSVGFIPVADVTLNYINE